MPENTVSLVTLWTSSNGIGLSIRRRIKNYDWCWFTALYLATRDSRKSLRTYIPARQCRRIDLPLCVLQCNGSQRAMHLIYPRRISSGHEMRGSLSLSLSLSNFSANVTRKYTHSGESIREKRIVLTRKNYIMLLRINIKCLRVLFVSINLY